MGTLKAAGGLALCYGVFWLISAVLWSPGWLIFARDKTNRQVKDSYLGVYKLCRDFYKAPRPYLVEVAKAIILIPPMLIVMVAVVILGAGVLWGAITLIGMMTVPMALIVGAAIAEGCKNHEGTLIRGVTIEFWQGRLLTGRHDRN